MEVIDFSGRDEALAHLCFACAEMLSARTPGKCRRVADLTRLFATYLAEKYIAAAAEKPDFHSGLPIWQLRKVEDYVREHLAEEISVETIGRTGGTESVPFFPCVQAGYGDDAAAIRDPGADHLCSTAHPRNLPQPHRNRARSRLHEPEPFRESLPARDGCDADGVPQCLVEGLAQSFPQECEQAAQDRARRTAR